MSVDCRLPDFSGDQGLIKQIIETHNAVDYREVINPKYFENHPSKFWYIYGDRYN